MSYVIPDSIYAEYEIVDKEILGKKHYGLVRIYRFGKLIVRRHMKVYDGVFDQYLSRGGVRWLTERRSIDKAIINDRSKRKDRYIEKHVK